MGIHGNKRKSKLSKGILDMKFMKRSKEKVEQESKEEEGREIFTKDLKPLKQKGEEFVIEPSFIPIDMLLSGRMSFKGMNPDIERLMESEKLSALQRKKEKERIRSNIPEIADEEMAQYLGKKIKNRFLPKRSLSDERGSSSDESSEVEEPPKKAKFKKPVDSD